MELNSNSPEILIIPLLLAKLFLWSSDI